MRTKTAWLTFGRHGKVTCTSSGEKDPWGEMIWRDKDGHAYELKYARRSGVWAFLPYSKYDLREGKE